MHYWMVSFLFCNYLFVTMQKYIFLPQNKIEKTIFFLSLIWFLSFSLFYAFNADFSVKNELMGYDSWFYIGSGNPKLTLSKLISWNLRHPLFVMINLPLLLIDVILPAKLHIPLFAFASSIIMSLSDVLIFKICENLSITRTNSILSVLLFPSFAHVLLLSGQPETYVYTIFFVLLLILLAHTHTSSWLSDNIIFAILTGTTLTNCVYFFIVKLWEKSGRLKESIITTLKSSYLFLPLFALTMTGLLYRYFFKHISLYESILNDTHKFVHESSDQLSLAWSNYLSEPILFHYIDQIVMTSNAEILPEYPAFYYNLIVLFILLMAVWGVIQSNKLLRNICISFFVYNFIIHFLCGYGINELQLFCGHWIFFVPILVAIGLNAIKAIYIRQTTQLLVLLCIIVFAFLNGYHYYVSILNT